LYSMIYFNAFNSDLRGIVNSPGYGSDNSWTHLNLHWIGGLERLTPEGETIIEWIWDEEPELLNPCLASTVYAWDIISKTLDGLTAVNPYTHEDTPWIAENWTVEEWPCQSLGGESWMNVTFTLRKDVFWQDGNPFTASDVEFSWLFLRDNAIPRYEGMWRFLDDVVVIDRYTVRAVMRTMNQFLLYDLSETGALLPPQVYGWLDGKGDDVIMQYDPTANTTSTGPWFGIGTGFPKTHLFGTGPFVFAHYDSHALVADLHQSANYFISAEEISELKIEMIHEIGDVNRDGYIGVFDLSTLGVAYGCFSWMPCYNVNADLNEDGVCDGRDLALITWHWGEQKEYPEP
jgi:ABC-type transport system substrate-binding protein